MNESHQESARIRFTLNGENHEVLFAPYKTLLEVLREDVGLTGTKHGCELGECGACSVLMNGAPVLSCLVLGVACEGATVVTVEGLAEDGKLSPMQDAIATWGGSQCGYCTPGILISLHALLAENPEPKRADIRSAISGNLCRCTGYVQILESVEKAVAAIRGEAP